MVKVVFKGIPEVQMGQNVADSEKGGETVNGKSDDGSGTIVTGRKRARKEDSQVHMIASILANKRTKKRSEASVPATKAQAGAHPKKVGRLIKKTTGRKVNRNNGQRRHRNASTLRLPSTNGKLEQEPQKIIRRRKWKGDNKGNAEGANGSKDLKRRQRRKKKKKVQNVPQDEISCIKRRVKYLLIKMKQEQNFIDAYLGEGWKGQSREKIRPEKELEKAATQILKYKMAIREAMHRLDILSSEGCIADTVIDPEGRVSHEHIFCALCKQRDAFPDNDIILCDGACNRGFHQKCLDPPLATESIPPEDQGWLCKVCECKLEGLEAINAHHGTQFTINNKWEEIFAEAARVINGENTDGGNGEEWPSEDSEDDDYDPEKSEVRSEKGYENDTDDSENSSSSDYSSDSDVGDKTLTYNIESSIIQRRKRNRDGARTSSDVFITIVDSDENGNEDSGAPVSGKRQRADVDYKKLHDEMFGKDSSDEDEHSNDEDWGPRRRIRREKQHGAFLQKNSASEEQSPAAESAKRERKSLSQNGVKTKRHVVRLSANAVQELRKVFAENELPSMSFKENLSQKLGISLRKVNMWFKNARYLALKNRKEALGKDKPKETEAAEKDKSEVRKGRHREEKTDSGGILPVIRSGYGCRIIKNKYRRRNLKSNFQAPVRNEKKITKTRLPLPAVEKLRQVFAENELPSMSYKMALSKQLGLPFKRVYMWFKNARYTASKMKKMAARNVPLIKRPETRTRNARRCHSAPLVTESNGDCSPYLQEMEFLTELEMKIENLRKKLDTLCPKRSSSENSETREPKLSTPSNSRQIMYIPVVEMREKRSKATRVR